MTAAEQAAARLRAKRGITLDDARDVFVKAWHAHHDGGEPLTAPERVLEGTLLNDSLRRSGASKRVRRGVQRQLQAEHAEQRRRWKRTAASSQPADRRPRTPTTARQAVRARRSARTTPPAGQSPGSDSAGDSDQPEPDWVSAGLAQRFYPGSRTSLHRAAERGAIRRRRVGGGPERPRYQYSRADLKRLHASDTPGAA